MHSAIVTVNSAATFEFKPLEAYFNAGKTEAVACGLTNGSIIIYNLYDLFSIANKNRAYVTFKVYTSKDKAYTVNK